MGREFTTWDEADTNYDSIFVTNPTYLHYETLRYAAKHTRKIFVEKPVFATGEEDVSSLDLTAEHICYVAAPLRFSRLIQYLKTHLVDKKVYSVRAVCSSYLPEWRPGTSWKECYSSSAAMGGEA